MVTVAEDLEKKVALEAAEEESSDEEEEDERIAKLRGYAAKHDAEETAAYLVGDKLGVDSKELGVHFLVEAIFDEEKPLAPQIKAKKAYLAKAVGDDAKLQMATLCAIELYVTETATDDFKKLVAVLKELYDGDVVEEEVILEWGADAKSAKRFGVDAKTGEAVRKQAKPFIEWLEQSDDDSDDSGETMRRRTGRVTSEKPRRRGATKGERLDVSARRARRTVDSIFYIETVTVFDHPPTTFAAARRAPAPAPIHAPFVFLRGFLASLPRASALGATPPSPPRTRSTSARTAASVSAISRFVSTMKSARSRFFSSGTCRRRGCFRTSPGSCPASRALSRALLVGVAGARHHHGVDGVFVALLVQERDVDDDKWVRVSLRGVEECPSRVVDKGCTAASSARMLASFSGPRTNAPRAEREMPPSSATTEAPKSARTGSTAAPPGAYRS